jgi:hypothetical protein
MPRLSVASRGVGKTTSGVAAHLSVCYDGGKLRSALALFRSATLFTLALLAALLNFAQPVLAYAHLGAGGRLVATVCSVEGMRVAAVGKDLPAPADHHSAHDCCAPAGAAAIPPSPPALALAGPNASHQLFPAVVPAALASQAYYQPRAPPVARLG